MSVLGSNIDEFKSVEFSTLFLWSSSYQRQEAKVIIGSDNGLSPIRRQAITWTNDGFMSIRTLNIFSEI